MKQCYKCNEFKELDLFYAHPGMIDGHINKCRSCTMLDGRKYYAVTDKVAWNKAKRNRYPRNKRKQKDTRLKKTYGVGIDWVESKTKEQNGLCFICKKERELVLDHNHTTGVPRAMLCKPCNSALGLIKENFETAINIAKYIQEDQGI